MLTGNPNPAGATNARPAPGVGYNSVPPLPAVAAQTAGNAGPYGIVDDAAFAAQCAFVDRRERDEELIKDNQRILERRLNAVSQASQGTRALTGTSYALEKLDPKHRLGDLLAIFKEVHTQEERPEKLFTWIKRMGPRAQLKLLAREFNVRGVRGPLDPEVAQAWLGGVKYMELKDRKDYRVTVSNGLLYQNGVVFDTRNLSTVHSGNGVAIFIQSPVGLFYSSSHILGSLHHSSFMSGRPVRSAGEWKVTNGKIDWISGKSGHYKPTILELLQAIKDLKAKNALGQAMLHVHRISDNNFVEILASGLEADIADYKAWG